jgi:hypothetical protein
MPTQNEFTEEQANDLARHFLGSQWVAHRFADGRCALAAIEPDVHYFSGPNWRTAFREAGVKLPFRKLYVNVGPRVLLEDEQVAVCKSNTFAQRTAAALNAYQPDPRLM